MLKFRTHFKVKKIKIRDDWELGMLKSYKAEESARECLSPMEEEKVQVDEQNAAKKIVIKLYPAALNSWLIYNVRGKEKEVDTQAKICESAPR